MGTKKSWKIDPERIALVVIDIQRRFLDQGAPKECLGAREMVPNINKLSSICRRLKIPVIQVRTARHPDLSDVGIYPEIHAETWPETKDSEYFTVEGRKGAEFYPVLKITKDDYIVTKNRPSAFIQGSSNLETVLRDLGRDAIIACGVATGGCVHATVSNAWELGFRVWCVADLTAPKDEYAIKHMGTNCGNVVTFEEIVRELEQLAAKALTAKARI